ncbi:hypothetical protein LIER_36744 [Lithospermum erythrorhizon]|uniref:UV radiation resistance-associated gene protein n=1 Tax=Lithospermum erythrorhizon TaxID=34254 RepID=A0AAV3PCW2_LITER
MESRKKRFLIERDGSSSEQKGVKIIKWEDFEHELVRLCSLSSAINQANQKKQLLQQNLHTHIHVEADSLVRLNALHEMREQLDARKLMMGNMLVSSNVLKEKINRQEEQLGAEIRSLLFAGSTLSVANKRFQESTRSLDGEKGSGYLKTLHKFLRARQQLMISQVSLLYPVKVVTGRAREQELESFTINLNSGDPSVSKPFDQDSLRIAGLHLTVIPFAKMSFFTDKKEVQRSATALGYVAHAVSLIASYLQIPLRYPVRFGCSRSYIRDFAPSIEPISLESAPNTEIAGNAKPVEFPLFLEGQDSTRTAYAVFLLNKDLEQLLNYIGVKSLGPRHVLANLRELIKTILSHEYIET